MFLFRSVDDRSYPFLRGTAAFYELFDVTYRRNTCLSSVCIIPGHVAVLLHDSKTLCVFDATPASHRISDYNTQVLIEIITGKRQGIVPDVLISTHSSPVVNVVFEKGPPTRLVVTQVDGLVFIWEWMSSDWIWKIVTKVSLVPSQLAKLADVGFSASPLDNHFTFVWLEQDILYSRVVQVPRVDLTKKRGDENPPPAIVSPVSSIYTFATTHKLFGGKGGQWIVGSDSVFFFSVRSQQILSVKMDNISSNGTHFERSPHATLQVLAATVHHTTQELLVLDRSGALFSCDVHNNKIVCTCVCVLSTRFKELPLSSTIYMLPTNHFVGIVADSTCHFFDIQCGEYLQAVSVPSSEVSAPWSFVPGFSGAPQGVWSRTGIWELRDAPVPKQAELIAKHTLKNSSAVQRSDSVRKIGCAASLCKDWALERLEAKYLLDQILSQIDEHAKREISNQLIPRLESPALLLALLSPVKSHEFLIEEISGFLNKYLQFYVSFYGFIISIYHGFASTPSAAQVAKISFMLHTPLNLKLVPLLHRYLQISQESVSSFGLPQHPIVDLANPVLSFGVDVWEHLIFCMPSAFLHNLEVVLRLQDLQNFVVGGIQSLPASFHIDSSLYEGSASHKVPRKAPIFEIMCRLYYCTKPVLLPFFVDVVNFGFNRQNNTMGPPYKKHGFYKRAIAALPLHSTHIASDEQIVARFHILCAAGNLADAMRVLLEYNKWDLAVQFVQQKMDHDVEHFVLFQLLVTQCLKIKNLERLQQIWELMPHGFGIFDLLSLMRHYLADTGVYGSNIGLTNRVLQNKVLCDSKNDIFAVGAIRSQILKMCGEKTG